MKNFGLFGIIFQCQILTFFDNSNLVVLSTSKDVPGLGVETESALFLQPGRETKQLVKYLFTRMEKEILDLRAKPIKTKILNKDVEIYVDIEPFQFDNSTLFHICGVDGAFCKVQV